MTSKANKPTISAISTSLGGGAMAVVRLSGEGALEIVKALTHKQDFPPRYATLCTLYDYQEILDEVIVIYFKAPHSYTREDVCEIQCHGGSVIAKRILELTLENGAILAQNGEFTKRAFLNGRIDLSQAQAVAQMMEAKSLQAQKALAKQLKGSLSEFVSQARESLFEVLAYSEVMIDYSDEDLPEDLIAKLHQKIDVLMERMQRILQYSLNRSGIFEGFSLCLVGKPNVGKSSLLNALLLYERAIVSEIAGTTRDTIEEILSIAGVQVRLIDTAGIRHCEDKIESIGIARSKECIAKSEIVLAIFDISLEWQKEDEEILNLLEANQDKKIIIVLNKSDLPPKLENERLKQYPCFYLSAKNQEIQSLLDYLQELVSLEDCSEILLSNTFQIQSLKDTLKSLNQAKLELDNGVLELFSYNIKESITLIGNITHPYESAELLDKIFGEFCLGK